MNRLQTFNGGHPLYFPTDISFVQDAYKEAIQGLTSMYGNNFILSGCLPNGSGGLTEGYVVLSGEVFKVDATEFIPDSDELVWAAVSFVDPNIGPVRYGDTELRECHMIRKAVLTTYSAQFIYANYTAVKRPFIYDRLSFAGSFSTQNTVPPAITLHLNRIHISGTMILRNNSTTYGPVRMAILPQWAYPSETKYFSCYGIVVNNFGRESWRVKIDTNGDLWILDQFVGHPSEDSLRDKICLDSIIYTV